MSFLSNNSFNARDVAPSTGFDPIPEGEYRVVIEKCEEKATKTGGEQIVISACVCEGQPNQGRKLFDRLNVVCPSSQKAEEIGKAQFSALCHAVGIMEPRSCDEFVGRTALVKLRVAKRQDNGELENKVTWKPLATATESAPPKTVAPAATASKPWGAKPA